jgi:pimeloyl-ACP methyl ester carboxylesterase
MARSLLRGAVGTGAMVEELLTPLDGLDLRELARRVEVPALVCWGQEDRLGVSNGPPLADALGAEKVAIPDVGHMPMIESPYALLAAFRALSRLSLPV